MAAYTAVISLLQTLQLFNVHTSQPFDSLYATAQYFQHALEKFSKNSGFDPKKIKSLEEKIRAAASEAEDVVEMKISPTIKANAWWTFRTLQHLNLLKVARKMDRTKKQVMKILSHDAVDQVLELSGDSIVCTASTSYPKLEDDIVHGLDDDLEIIVERLKGPPRDLDVVTISGMGGIGKTTLARKAYHHLTIRYHFDILAWVTISQQFRYRNVLLEALYCISKKTDIVNSKDCDMLDDNELGDVVQKSLKGRRYLVVVDDIWSTDVWDNIRGLFPNDYNNGSRILMTTREPEVAMYASTSSPHEMSPLSVENGWRLLCDKVFGPKQEHPPNELEEIGKEIIEKCQGLPLTISVIAGHLSKVARTLQGWNDVARNLTEIIASHPNECLGVLGLSYHHLPNHLKPCFLSMSIFPDDFQFDARILIQLWIAEGFIRTSGSGKSLEEVAMDYLEDLVSRNLIQARKRKINGEIKDCGIHDLLREFCLMEAEMTMYMHVERTELTVPTKKHNFRRFSFQIESYSVDDCRTLLPPVARSIHIFSKLDLPLKLCGTLLRIPSPYQENRIILEFLFRFKLLRVLAIFNGHECFESFPPGITLLCHLRYLQIRFNGFIPESISKLQNLQTLICCRGLNCSDSPDSPKTPSNRRWIFLKHTISAVFDTLLSTFLKSPSVTTDSAGITDSAGTTLTAVRHHYHSLRSARRGFYFPEEIWTMKNLRFICMMEPTCLPSPRTEHLVTGLPNLKEFSVLSYTSCTSEVFSGIPNLQRLTMSVPSTSSEVPPQVIDMSRLTKLEAFKLHRSSVLEDSIKRFVFPTSLRRLSLRWCRDFDWADISSTVMMLPNLEEFKLKNSHSVRSDVWKMSDQDKLESLKFLLLSGVDLGRWEASSDNFPILKRLILKKCYMLQEIPADFGEICTLESIELHDCNFRAEKSARNILQEQEGMGNNSLNIYIH